MSFFPQRTSNPPTSPSPDIQGARTLAAFLSKRGSATYHESPNSQEFASRSVRTTQTYEQRKTTQSQGPNHPRDFAPGNAGRHPNLSLDTRNLVPTSDPPSPSSIPAPLHADLTALKSGLESLWTRSAHSLHTLHHALATERDACSRILREREMLRTANARLWEDKARLEGEKRELRARLNAQAATADIRERAEGSRDVKVKTEEMESDDLDPLIPLREVQRMIEERLQNQSDEFARETAELYSKLGAAQMRATDLEAHLIRSSTAPSPASASLIRPQLPAKPSSPTTPHTAHPSAHSEREFFFRRGSVTGSGTTIGTVGMSDPRMYGHASGSVHGAGMERQRVHTTQHDTHARVQEQGSHPYSAPGNSRAHGEPRHNPAPGDVYPPQRSHVDHQPQSEEQPSLPTRTVSLPNPSPPVETPFRRTTSGPATVSHSVTHRIPPPPPPPPQSYTHPDLHPTRPPPPRHSQSQRPHNSLPHLSPKRSPKRSPPHPPPLQESQHALPRPPPRQPSPVPPAFPPPPPPLPPAQTHRTSTQPASPSVLQKSSISHTDAAVHSRPGTPTGTRPAKRARTEEVVANGATNNSNPNHNSTMDTSPISPADSPQREMTADERRTLGALSSVLTKKRDGAGWKCVLCRQEKKNPATFSETTPIGDVTAHVRGLHVVFWKTLGGTSEAS